MGSLELPMLSSCPGHTSLSLQTPNLGWPRNSHSQGTQDWAPEAPGVPTWVLQEPIESPVYLQGWD